MRTVAGCTICWCIFLMVGCQKPQSGVTVGPPEAKIGVADVSVTVNDTREGQLSAPVSAKIPVAGSFRLTDPSQSPTPVIAQVVRFKNGRKVISNSVAIEPLQDGDKVRFEGEVPAPKDSGTYQLEVLEGQEQLIKRSVTVTD
jgi:hypothetical protein